MARFLLTLVFAWALAPWSTAQAGAARATAAEARAFVERAVAHYEAEGEQALEDFTRDDSWKDRDLYIFALDRDGVTVAHGFKPALIGVSAWNLRDVDGKLYIREIVAAEDRRTVDYVWQNPATGQMERKESFVVRSGDLVIGAGYYRER